LIFGCVPKNVLGTELAPLSCMLAALRRFRPPFCPNPKCTFHRNP
jgi:hypothetical protein